MAESGLKFSGDPKELEKAYRKAFALQEKAIRKAEQANERLRSQSRTHRSEIKKYQEEEATGQEKLVGGIGRYLGAIGTVSVALMGVKRLWQDIRQEMQGAVESIKQSEMPLAQLGQVTTPGRPLSLLIEEAQKTSRETGMTIGEAAAFQFTLESRGMGRERAWLGALFPTIQPEAVIGAAGALEAGFGRAEVGAPRQVVNKLLAAAARSPLTASEFGGVVGGIGPAFREIGGREEEALAAVAAGARAAGGEEGATAMARLASWMGEKKQKRFQGKGFLGGVEAILEETGGIGTARFQALGMPIRAKRGLGLFQTNRELITDIMAEIETAGAEAPGQDRVSRLVAEREAVPELWAAGASRRAEQVKALAKMGFSKSLPELRAETAMTVAEAMDWEAERTWLGRAEAKFTRGLSRLVTPKALEERVILAELPERFGERAGEIIARRTAGPELGRDPGEHVDNE